MKQFTIFAYIEIMSVLIYVLQLKAKFFGLLTFEQTLIIIKNGRPCPSLKNLASKFTEINSLLDILWFPAKSTTTGIAE